MEARTKTTDPTPYTSVDIATDSGDEVRPALAIPVLAGPLDGPPGPLDESAGGTMTTSSRSPTTTLVFDILSPPFQSKLDSMICELPSQRRFAKAARRAFLVPLEISRPTRAHRWSKSALVPPHHQSARFASQAGPTAIHEEHRRDHQPQA